MTDFGSNVEKGRSWNERLKWVSWIWLIPAGIGNYLAQNYGWYAFLGGLAAMIVLMIVNGFTHYEFWWLGYLITAGLFINLLWLSALLWHQLELQGRLIAMIVAGAVFGISFAIGMDFQFVALTILLLTACVLYFTKDWRQEAWPYLIVLAFLAVPGMLWEYNYRMALTAARVDGITITLVEERVIGTGPLSTRAYTVSGRMPDGRTRSFKVIDSWWRLDWRSQDRAGCMTVGETVDLLTTGIRLGRNSSMPNIEGVFYEDGTRCRYGGWFS